MEGYYQGGVNEARLYNYELTIWRLCYGCIMFCEIGPTKSCHCCRLAKVAGVLYYTYLYLPKKKKKKKNMR
jgi:hypothetical protein